MKKMKWYNKKIWMLVLCISVLFFPIIAIGKEHLILYENESLRIWLTDIEKHGNILRIGYQVENLSQQTLWFCGENDFTKEYQIAEAGIDEESGRLFLKINNPQLPESIYFCIPLTTTFIQIASQKTRDFELALKFPIYSNVPFKRDDSKKLLEFEKLRILSIEIGYYNNNDLETLSLWDDKAFKDDEVSVVGYWAKSHEAMKIFVVLDKTIIEEFLAQLQ